MADNPNIIAADSDGNELTDAQVEVNGIVPGEGGSTGSTDVSVEDSGTETVSALSVLDFVAGVSVTDNGNGEAQINVQVDTSQIAGGAVTTAKIDSAAVTAAKIAADAVGADEIGLSITPTWTGNHTFDSTVILADQAADPSANGEVQRNGSDVKVYSGGAVRNLSNIGSGGTDTRTDVSDDGTQVVGDVSDINFGPGVTVIDDGDGSVTVQSDHADAMYAEGYLSSNVSGVTSGSMTNIVDTIKDGASYFDSNYEFSVPETGKYEVTISVKFNSPADQDSVFMGVENVTDSTYVLQNQGGVSGSSNTTRVFSTTKTFESGKKYRFVATNYTSDYALVGDEGATYGLIKRSVVEP